MDKANEGKERRRKTARGGLMERVSGLRKYWGGWRYRVVLREVLGSRSLLCSVSRIIISTWL
jgi:hypothetical protein